MAVGKDTVWRIRPGGDETNGGGFDSTISGAGTDYTDQDSAQLSLTDLACTAAANTTLTSATGGFTSAMIGNCIRIDASVSGTNFIDGYFFITGHTDTNTVTIDRTCNNGSDASSGTGKVGGAHADMRNYSDSGTATAPLVSSPVVAGNTVKMLGTKAVDPVLTTDVEYTQSGYYSFPDGDPNGDGVITLEGYGASDERPLISVNGLLMHAFNDWIVKRIKIQLTSNSNGSFGIINGRNLVLDCIIDQDGNNVVGTKSAALHSEFKNSGSTTATASAAIIPSLYNRLVAYNYIHDWRGGGIEMASGIIGHVNNNVIADCGDHGIQVTGNVAKTWLQKVFGNSVHGCTGDGIRILSYPNVIVRDNVVTDCTAYGIHFVSMTAADIDKFHQAHSGNNAVYNNTTADYNNVSAMPGDVTLTGDPFTASGSGDFSLNNTAGAGAACRDIAVKVGTTD